MSFAGRHPIFSQREPSWRSAALGGILHGEPPACTHPTRQSVAAILRARARCWRRCHVWRQPYILDGVARPTAPAGERRRARGAELGISMPYCDPPARDGKRCAQCLGDLAWEAWWKLAATPPRQWALFCCGEGDGRQRLTVDTWIVTPPRGLSARSTADHGGVQQSGAAVRHSVLHRRGRRG